MNDISQSHIDALPRVSLKSIEPGTGLAASDAFADRPYVIKGYVADWDLVNAGRQGLTAFEEYLQPFYNNQPVVISRGPAENKGRIFYNDDMSLNVQLQKAQLQTVFQEIAKAQGQTEQACIYLAATAIDSYFPGLQAQNPIDLGAQKAFGRIWMGTRTQIAPHNDSQYNLACLIAGRRRFTLFPPEAFRNLYLGPFDNTPAGRPISMVDVCNPDFKTYPKFRQALQQAVVAELEPGDALYIPALWWHHVEGMAPFNVLINYWWRPADNLFVTSEPAFDHAILAFRDLPPSERAYWREMFDHYIFNAAPENEAHIPEGKRGVLEKMTPALARTMHAKLKNYFQR